MVSLMYSVAYARIIVKLTLSWLLPAGAFVRKPALARYRDLLGTL